MNKITERIRQDALHSHTKDLLSEVEGMKDNRDMESMFFSKEDRVQRDARNSAIDAVLTLLRSRMKE